MAQCKRRARVAAVIVASLASCASAAEKKEFRYNVAPGATISVINEFGPLTLTPSSGPQVIITALPSSDKVEVDGAQYGQRIEVSTHFLQKAGRDDGRVEYQVQVPANCNVMMRSVNGPISVHGVGGDITIDADSGSIDVRDMGNGDLRVHTVSGPVALSDVRNGRVEVASVSGDVSLNHVSGSRVTVNTTGGAIRYAGSFDGGGEYAFTTHSGTIEAGLPANASVDINARSVTGPVENEFPLQPPRHANMTVSQGHSFAGTANAGASSVRLRSFSGRIHVKKL